MSGLFAWLWWPMGRARSDLWLKGHSLAISHKLCSVAAMCQKGEGVVDISYEVQVACFGVTSWAACSPWTLKVYPGLQQQWAVLQHGWQAARTLLNVDSSARHCFTLARANAVSNYDSLKLCHLIGDAWMDLAKPQPRECAWDSQRGNTPHWAFL